MNLIDYTVRDGLSLTLPGSDRQQVRCTGVDEWVIRLDGLPIWATRDNLLALHARITVALCEAGEGDELVTPERLAKVGGLG